MDEYFMEIVESVARASTCIRHKFGCVIVDENNKVVSTGYNDPVRGTKKCESKSCSNCKNFIISKDLNKYKCTKNHLPTKYAKKDDPLDTICGPYGNYQSWEWNGKSNVCIKEIKNIPSGQGHEICPAVHAEQDALLRNKDGHTLYVNGPPCQICARLIINAGIKRVVYWGDYPNKDGLKTLSLSGVKVEKIEKYTKIGGE